MVDEALYGAFNSTCAHDRLRQLGVGSEAPFSQKLKPKWRDLVGGVVGGFFYVCCLFSYPHLEGICYSCVVDCWSEADNQAPSGCRRHCMSEAHDCVQTRHVINTFFYNRLSTKNPKPPARSAVLPSNRLTTAACRMKRRGEMNEYGTAARSGLR